jgi:hypothetical protein
MGTETILTFDDIASPYKKEAIFRDEKALSSQPVDQNNKLETIRFSRRGYTECLRSQGSK